MSDLPESIMAQLRKVAALADSGVGGERENARAMLARLCEKHGITPQALLSQERDEVVTFKFTGDHEKAILSNVLLFVCQRRDLRYVVIRGGWRLLLTKAEAIDARACWAHYRKLWAEEVDMLSKAFVHRHGIFGPPRGEESPPPTAEDIKRAERLIAMMRGLSADTWRRPAAMLEGGR